MIEIPYYETSNFALHNFSAHAITYEGVVYPTVEHAYHALKFKDNILREKVRTSGSPLAAWELARDLKPQRRIDWDDIKVTILTDLIRAKVAQHRDVRDTLIATGSEEIVELNPNDDFWGSGADGKGQNNTGKILMKIREEITLQDEPAS